MLVVPPVVAIGWKTWSKLVSQRSETVKVQSIMSETTQPNLWLGNLACRFHVPEGHRRGP